VANWLTVSVHVRSLTVIFSGLAISLVAATVPSFTPDASHRGCGLLGPLCLRPNVPPLPIVWFVANCARSNHPGRSMCIRSLKHRCVQTLASPGVQWAGGPVVEGHRLMPLRLHRRWCGWLSGLFWCAYSGPPPIRPHARLSMWRQARQMIKACHPRQSCLTSTQRGLPLIPMRLFPALQFRSRIGFAML